MTRFALFHADELYSRQDLMDAFNLKDDRAFDKWLKEMAIRPCKAPGRGKKQLFSGRAILISVERMNRWGDDDE